MRKSYEDWLKKCMHIRVEGRSVVGRPRDTVRECGSRYGRLEIDREDVHDRKECEMECYEEEVQPYQKTDYKPILIWRYNRRDLYNPPE